MKDGRPKRGMDRDLALKVLALCSAVKDALDDLLETMFIIYQPKDATGAVGDPVVFTVTAMNVNSYQWQVSKIGTETWTNSSSPGNATASVTVTVTSSVYNYRLRCKLTDADGNILYTAGVFLPQPD